MSGAGDGVQGGQRPSSFAKGLFCGQISDALVFPFPALSREEQDRVDALVGDLREWAREHYDAGRVEAEGWIGDRTVTDLGKLGLLGLGVPRTYGGQGLSEVAYARVFSEFGEIDASLTTVMGVHQSLASRAIRDFGTGEQRERFLPDLAAGRKLAAFALSEPAAGSDAYHLRSRAEPQADGSFLLNGEKRFIGQGNRDVVVAFARGEAGHVALILEAGMPGLSSPFRYPTLGLAGNDLRHLEFHDVRVPPENVLGEPGRGFEIAMRALTGGRLSLGAGAVGAARHLIEVTVDHVRNREQFGRPLADFELVEEKVAWMVSYLFGFESMVYLTCGLADDGRDVSVESAMIKVSGTEFLWYAVNRAFQLAGGDAYITGHPLERLLRDARILPVFEGANDVLRVFVALSGLRALGEELEELRGLDLTSPIRSLGLVADYVMGRIRQEVQPDRLTRAHPGVEHLAAPLADQVQRLRGTGVRLLRRHGEGIRDRQWQLKRLAHAAMDIVAQVATLSRVSGVLEEQDVELSGEERYIAETFCTRAARRVRGQLDRVEHNDDARMHAIARAAYRHGRYRLHI